MIQIRVTIPDRLAKQLEECELEESEVIAQALDRFFLKTPSIDNIQWQKSIEMKLIDLQNQLDAHRNGGNKHDTVLDSSATKRGIGIMDPLDISTSEDVRVTIPKPRVPKVESTLGDFEIPL